jgi:nucleoside-diphosphate-sugar epimerase
MNSLKKKTILITGATSFVGSNLLRRLTKSGADLHIITRESSNLWRIGDIISLCEPFTNVPLNYIF